MMLYKRSSSPVSETEEFIKLVATLNDGITSSRHILANGEISHYFIDFDLITSKSDNCRKVGDAFVAHIKSIQKHSINPPNLLGFIEKDGIGTTGAIRFASDLSKQTSISNITIRQWKDVPCEIIKAHPDLLDNSEDKNGRLHGKNILLVGDVSTSSTELWKAINSIRDVGGNVRDIVLYYSRLSKEAIDKFRAHNIAIYPLILPSHARYIAYQQSLNGVDIRSIEGVDTSRMESIFLKADQGLMAKGLLVGDSPIVSRIITTELAY